MGRFHRHEDGTVHAHDHAHDHEHDHHHDHTHEHTHEVGDHSGYETGRERIEVLEDIFSENDRRAASNRAAFAEHGVLAINVMSSPGAGKTTLLEKTLAELGQDLRFGVVEGDIETAIDADRLRGFGAQVSLLNTGNGFGGECHLDAPMVSRALEGLELSTLDVVMIENVGNLVCPAEFEVGEHKKVMIASVTEGEDKPLKYPVMFRSVEVVVINKIDLLPYLDFNLDLFTQNIAQVNPEATVIEVSTKTGEGLEQWFAWIRKQSQQRG
ncbi:hydrogenase nickel incorporation protein HypB [Corynebacterium sp. 153RC1]|uniref:hydrogenase nickel incorporation protein HypB n=1 Tax=unclassified Corynebacterium TaxID=2624378 RepID=UPI00211C5821|nr:MULTISPECIES: hydrogenase nickel incorporation protein HypB [unclassified Corynebacterium]MCQ9352640.1 hydrogenase nickel incorporation protein HypB [Corynebacterium sp. 209RC1]MCQ9354824.1 hydrogenase nickel incorporation protein HypB [Corynebacterium sp. 1222RC1]MCQ9357009.1 hydrogenase nickel incorporation protein HypB [Corynebacterium sp. 122RC1]MCQ9359092.1 hydrogenase nickel incorporation protein HypB [Corynebacterium sp. 142RC1]MCQ9361477.1 hydrogenase nickel incorporation protein Hy